MIPHICLGIPCYGPVDARFMTSLIRLDRAVNAMEDPPFRLHLDILTGNSDIRLARNILASRFLHNEALTHLFFIDSDILFEPDQFFTFVKDHATLPPDSIICGRYAMKQQGPPIWTHRELAPRAETHENGVREIDSAGCGFMLIPRSVIAAVSQDAEIFPLAQNQVGWDFFCSGVYDGRYHTEDFAFCVDAIASGAKIYLHDRITLNHLGTIAYPVD